MAQGDQLDVFLRGSRLSQSQRADAWDAFNQAADVKDLEKRLDATNLPNDVKANLWDLKATGAITPAAPAGKPQVAPSITDVTNLVGNVGTGAAMGATETAGWLGRQISNIPSLGPAFTNIGNQLGGAYARLRYGSEAVPQPVTYAQGESALRQETQPQNTAQATGKALERAGEYYLTGAAAGSATALPRVATAARVPIQIAGQGTAAGTTAVAHGEDPTLPVLASAAVPIVGAGVNAIGRAAVPLARSALKIPLSMMQQQAGASVEGANAIANRITRFIIDNRLTTPERAQALIDATDTELNQLITSAPTDAPHRVMRYLAALRRNAARQALPAADVTAIDNAAREIVESSDFAETVMRTVNTPHPTLVTPSGQPVMVPTQVPGRHMRPNMPANEAMNLARATGRWSNRKAYGELKGAAQESSKAGERAARDAVKQAIPATRPFFTTKSRAITAKSALERMNYREANREALGLPELVAAGVSNQATGAAILGLGTRMLRTGSLRAGIMADQLSNALRRNDVATTAAILHKLGVSWTELLGGEDSEVQPTEDR